MEKLLAVRHCLSSGIWDQMSIFDAILGAIFWPKSVPLQIDSVDSNRPLSSLPFDMSAMALLGSVDQDLRERLHTLYHDASKHSVYQSVPAFIARALGYQEEIHSLWRSDSPRYDYIAERLNVPADARVADIGANTGFFSLNLAHDRPDCSLVAYEGNPPHAEFIRLAAKAFGLKVQVRSELCDLNGLARLPEYHAILLLNVLHHAGFDFDRQVPDNNQEFTAYSVEYLQTLRRCTPELVFQIGSNRGGDKSRPVVSRDDDVARLVWTASVLGRAGWTIKHVGYADLQSGAVRFKDANDDILAAVQAISEESDLLRAKLAALELSRFPGEFHRRPLILASRDGS